MASKIFHITTRPDGKELYFATLSSIPLYDKYLTGVSMSLLYKHNFQAAPFENDKVIIRRGEIITGKEARRKKPARRKV